MEDVPFAVLTDRQKRKIELRQLANEDEQFRNWPLTWVARDRRGYALYKDRWAISAGLLGRESGWDIDAMPVADFGNINAAGALTIRTGFNVFPLINPAHKIGSQDNEPFEDPGGLITGAVIGDRQIGTSRGPIAICLGAYLVHATAAAAVYNPVTTVLNIRVLSAALTVGGAFTTEATLNASTAANFIDQVPITATTGRTVTDQNGIVQAGIFALFNGDACFAELVMAGVVNLQTNVIYAMLELA